MKHITYGEKYTGYHPFRIAFDWRKQIPPSVIRSIVSVYARRNMIDAMFAR